MIKFDRFTLKNGLRIIVHKDQTTPLAVMNILFDVGARDENPAKTGFAHLFEHLMFGGSINIPSYDDALQKASGNNNAFTTNDITNFYLTLPVENLETAFWLESDRMLSLSFSEKSLDVQRSVVIEEFRQRYLNQPYGDIWLLFRPLVYRKHPYKWATIGKNISHIANATMQDVRDFFYAHYAPNNAIMTVTGNIDTGTVKKLAEKWFGPIEKRNIAPRKLLSEPVQRKERKLEVYKDVPYDMIVKAWHMCAKNHPDYPASDIITDILSGGKSSRLYQILVKEKKLFSEVEAYIMGSLDDGLLIAEGSLVKGVSVKKAESALMHEIEKLTVKEVSEKELDKIKNKIETTVVLSHMSPLNKAMGLSYYELLGNADLINSEPDKYRQVSSLDIKRVACNIFRPSNCSSLYYYSKH